QEQQRQQSDPSYAERLGRIELTLRYSPARQSLVLACHRVQLLPQTAGPTVDTNLCNPYVKFSIEAAESSAYANQQSKKQSKRTGTARSTLTPVFDESFDFQVNEIELSYRYLRVRVLHRKPKSKSILPGPAARLSRGVLLGSARISLADFEHNSTAWYELG
ncbi:hypothetical protein BOX15_Mlig026219g3, partial [Macrostomum lignano]